MGAVSTFFARSRRSSTVFRGAHVTRSALGEDGSALRPSRAVRRTTRRVIPRPRPHMCHALNRSARRPSCATAFAARQTHGVRAARPLYSWRCGLASAKQDGRGRGPGPTTAIRPANCKIFSACSSVAALQIDACLIDSHDLTSNPLLRTAAGGRQSNRGCSCGWGVISAQAEAGG